MTRPRDHVALPNLPAAAAIVAAWADAHPSSCRPASSAPACGATTDRTATSTWSCRRRRARYRVTLATLGLTQNAGAELAGGDGRTSRRWANAERHIPPPAARFLRYLVRVGADAAKAAAILNALEGGG